MLRKQDCTIQTESGLNGTDITHGTDITLSGKLTGS